MQVNLCKRERRTLHQIELLELQNMHLRIHLVIRQKYPTNDTKQMKNHYLPRLYLQLQFHNSRSSTQMFSQLQLEFDDRSRDVFEIVVSHVLLEAERFRNVGRQKDV